MRRIIERQYQLSEEEVQEAILQYLDNLDYPIPSKDDDHEFKPVSGTMEVILRWTVGDDR